MIAFDATSQGSALPGNSITYSHTNTGSDGILFSFIHRGGSGTDETMSATYNGVSMTQFEEQSTASTRIWGFYLVNPAAGTHDVVITCGDSDFHRSYSVSYTGVRQSSQPDNSTGTSGTGTSQSTSLTPVANNCWSVSFVGSSGGNEYTASTGVSAVRNSTYNTIMKVGDSDGPITPPASYTQTWTCTSQEGCVIQASFAPLSDDISGYIHISV